MINFDTSRQLPTGTTGWQELLTAISESAATDETIWVEHKAGLDPATKAGGAALAKAIVAFGNREVAVAARHLGGHAIIVVGLEPGSTPGTAPIDPAKLRDNVDRYIAAPAPSWDSVQHTYNGQNVLVVIVDPPRDGDPIFVLGKGGGDPAETIRDGAIYVRRPGKSDLATSADIRKLETRASASGVIAPMLDIDIEPSSDEYAIPWLDDYDSTWVDRYLGTRRTRLLRPLKPKPSAPSPFGFYEGTVQSAARALELQLNSLGSTLQEETRTEEEFRDEVEAWAVKATPGLMEYVDDQRHHHALPLTLTVRNNTERNYVDLRIEIHIHGPVWAYEDHLETPRSITELTGREPRKWGPRRIAPNYDAIRRIGANMKAASFPIYGHHHHTATVRSSGHGHAVISFPEFDLRPGHQAHLEEVYLIADAPFSEVTTVSWVATAKNVDALAEGTFTLPLSQAPTITAPDS